MQPGLEGVVVAETVLSHAEPEHGMLWVRGRPIPDLVALLWNGFVGADLTRVPREAFTAVFAISRSAGWIAHALEQQKTGRIIRPVSHYVEPAMV